MSVTRISDDELDALRTTCETMAQKCGLPHLSASVDRPHILNDVRRDLMEASKADTHERALRHFRKAHEMFSEFDSREQKTTLESVLEGFEEWSEYLQYDVGDAPRS